MQTVTGFLGVEVKPGQIWLDDSQAQYGDIARHCVTRIDFTSRGVACVELTNCAHMRKTYAVGQGQIDSFTLACRLTDEKPAPELFGGYRLV